jgi:hypothetical protein
MTSFPTNLRGMRTGSGEWGDGNAPLTLQVRPRLERIGDGWSIPQVAEGDLRHDELDDLIEARRRETHS